MSDCVHGLLTPAGPFAAIGVGLVSAWAISATPFVLVGEAVRGPDTAREIEFHFEPPKTSKPGNQS